MNEGGDQVTTALNRITDVLECLAERQGPELVNQPRNQKRGEDRALERFLKFTPPRFMKDLISKQQKIGLRG